MKTAEEIKAIAEPVIERNDLFLVDLSVSKDNVIEIFIDALTGVNVETCIRISKEIEKHLNRDEDDFELTVSSAGIGYPFKVPGQYKKNLGKVVEVKLNDNNKYQGILKEYSDTSVILECEEKATVEGKKKKVTVKIERNIKQADIKQIKDIIIF